MMFAKTVESETRRNKQLSKTCVTVFKFYAGLFSNNKNNISLCYNYLAILHKVFTFFNKKEIFS